MGGRELRRIEVLSRPFNCARLSSRPNALRTSVTIKGGDPRDFDAQRAAPKDVGVDHRGADVLVAEELLDGSDVEACLEKVGGERMAEGVRAHGLGDAGGDAGPVNGPLKDCLVQMVASALASCPVGIVARRGEDPLPRPLSWSGGVLDT